MAAFPFEHPSAPRQAYRKSRLHHGWMLCHRRLARLALHSGRGAAEVERGPEGRCRLEGVEQNVAFHPEQHRVHLSGDGGIPRGTIEQAALTETVASTEMHNGPAATAHHDETIHDGVEGIGRIALNNDVDP